MSNKKTLEERIYSNFHASLKAASRMITSEMIKNGTWEDNWDSTNYDHDEIRRLALSITAKRYKVTESEVSQIARKLRRTN